MNQLIKLTEIEEKVTRGSTDLEKKELKKYLNHMKDEAEKHFILTSHIFEKKTGRSKSCYPVITRPPKQT